MSEELLKQVIVKIDAALAQDPNLMEIDDQLQPVAVVHAKKRSAWVDVLAGKAASEALQIAARAQHIRRWEIPRDSYPRDRIGYLKWRTDLQQFHAAKTAEIMQAFGYDEAAISRVKALMTKKRLKQDPEVQILEDALCLVFLETQFSQFAQNEPDKITNILQKTWKKMSPQGQQLALQLPMDEAARAIIERALAESS
jgi:hypothetical protein